MITQTVLIVDDDKSFVYSTQNLLELEGLHIITAYNGLEALERISCTDIHLILLDLIMPELDGISTMVKIRKTKNIPIIVISAKSDETDKISALSMGADDYICKPFSSGELIARVKSQLRRYCTLGCIDNYNCTVIKNGDLTLDLNSKILLVNEKPVRLTATEYKIVELLMKNLDRVFSVEEIYSNVWNEDAYAVENTVMVHIRRIREKIELNPKTPQYLKVVWGIGYKIEKVSSSLDT